MKRIALLSFIFGFILFGSHPWNFSVANPFISQYIFYLNLIFGLYILRQILKQETVRKKIIGGLVLLGVTVTVTAWHYYELKKLIEEPTGVPRRYYYDGEL